MRWVALGPKLTLIRQDGTIRLGDLPAPIQLLEAAFGDPSRVATVQQ